MSEQNQVEKQKHQEYYNSQSLSDYYNNQRQKEFICGCGKAYMSYPALFTHVKYKHQGKQPQGSVKPPSKYGKRGRPPIKSKIILKNHNSTNKLFNRNTTQKTISCNSQKFNSFQNIIIQNNQLYQKNKSNQINNCKRLQYLDNFENNNELKQNQIANQLKSIFLSDRIIMRLKNKMDSISIKKENKINQNVWKQIKSYQTWMRFLNQGKFNITKSQFYKQYAYYDKSKIGMGKGLKLFFDCLQQAGLQKQKFEQIFLLFMIYCQYVIDEINRKEQQVLLNGILDLFTDYLNTFVVDWLPQQIEQLQLQNVNIFKDRCLTIFILNEFFQWMQVNDMSNSNITLKKDYFDHF